MIVYTLIAEIEFEYDIERWGREMKKQKDDTTDTIESIIGLFLFYYYNNKSHAHY